MAGAKNPYELAPNPGAAAAGGAPPSAPPAVPTEDEKREKLKGYIRVEKEFWPSIKYGEYVRYVKNNGELVVGGLVAQNPSDITPPGETEQTRIMRLRSVRKTRGRHNEWSVKYDEVEEFYVKASGAVLTLQYDLVRCIESLSRANRQLMAEIRELRGELRGAARGDPRGDPRAALRRR